MLKPSFFVFIYNDQSSKLCDFVADNFHKDFDIKYLDETHPKEIKESYYYKTIAGSRLCPFIGCYDDKNQIIDAIWGEASEINQESITNFFNKWKN